ncbi:histidinol phosphate phosphatase domain-containing protein [Methanolapillus ohkumae]|uniref:Phosphatase YcdX n=1 Tax=Methanolapillus ohkumae TaxID=3028298 RepID=A0AA97A5X6_9EURY|nr:phosphatase YcdX [Methanosarcinaceae archaeon Am2]
MIDLHTHTLFSDGVLIPSEHVRRAVVHGYRAIAMTDHADFTNFEFIISSLEKAKYLEKEWDITVLSGIEITHVPPSKIDLLAKKAKEAGADIVVVHGETIVEPVAPGTNLASVRSEYVDILAHPGFLTIEEAELARENNVCIEITARSGHNRTNGHVAKVAAAAHAKIVCNTDAHNPGDMISKETAFKILQGAGLSDKDAEKAFLNSAELVKRLRKY